MSETLIEKDGITVSMFCGPASLLETELSRAQIQITDESNIVHLKLSQVKAIIPHLTAFVLAHNTSKNLKEFKKRNAGRL